MRIRPSDRGSALLTVLWLSAALSAIAFAMSMTVRSETERTATSLDDLRSYYLASAGVEKAAMEVLFSMTGSKTIPQDATSVDYPFPSGVAHVEIIPEAGKMNINRASVDDLAKLISALGVEGSRASAIASGIVEWRSPGTAGGAPGLNLSPNQSFSAPHASFQEIEELLSVRGVTPDIFYGTFAPDGDGDPSHSALVRHAGLNDCLTVYGSPGGVDLSSAEPAVLRAMGASRPTGGPSTRMQQNSIISFRSTAKLKLPNGQFSDMRRTVGAQVKYVPQPAEVPYLVLRWYDTAWSY